MTDFRTAKKPEVKTFSYTIQLPSGGKVTGEGFTQDEAIKDAEGKAAHLSKSR